MGLHFRGHESFKIETKSINEPPFNDEQITKNKPSRREKFKDKFENNPLDKAIFNRVARKELKAREAHAAEMGIDVEFLSDNAREEEFIKNPNLKAYLNIVKSFNECYETGAQSKFFSLDTILIDPSSDKSDPLVFADDKTALNFEKLEAWHDKNAKNFRKEEDETRIRNWKRNVLIEEEGAGFGGRMTNVIGKTKESAYFTKNNLTLRGNMFKINNGLWGKTIYEMLPRYGSRKGRHIGVRVSQFTINTILMAAGYGCAPVSFGVSVIVSNQVQTAVTLTGEVIALKLGGAKKRKITSHATLRGVQLEALRVPLVGTVVNYGESIMFGSAALGIVATTIADWLFDSMSPRYTQTINTDDLGDPQVLFEMGQRIDYLSRFLIPYGQYLLLQEKNRTTQSPEQEEKKLANEKKLRKVLKKYSEILKDMEHKNLKTLNYYRLALMANKVPQSHRDVVSEACEDAQKNIRIKTHRTVSQCLATLMAADKKPVV